MKPSQVMMIDVVCHLTTIFVCAGIAFYYAVRRGVDAPGASLLVFAPATLALASATRLAVVSVWKGSR